LVPPTAGDAARATPAEHVERDAASRLAGVRKRHGPCQPREIEMLRQMRDMPAGTIGFEASGEVDDDDFEEVVAPVLRRQIATGAKLRLLYLLGPQLREYEGDALKEEMKFAARHATAYERVAVVSDESWLRPGLRILSILVPGQLRGFPVADLHAAKRWVAAGNDERVQEGE
jgi:SpoIIAA-like